jgi:hypothetical protein
MDEPKLSIRKNDLRQDLVRAAQVRAGVSMLAMLVSLVVGGAILPKAAGDSPLVLLAVFGPFVLICWLMTVCYCRPKVICPYCLHSLWDCGTGNFKPGRIKVRKDAGECPGCGSPIR